MIRFWYWLTPLFIVLDWLFGITWRVAGLDESAARGLYYVFCLACACVIMWRNTATAWVGLVESSINFGLLIIAVGSSLIYAPANYSAGQSIWIMTPGRLINFLLVGTILIASINQAIRALRPVS